MKHKQNHILIPIWSLKRSKGVGAKAHSLGFLERNGFKVPETYVIPAEYQKQYHKDPHHMLERLEHEFRSRLRPGVSYAIRSSASVEDGMKHSFAGQFETILNVREALALSKAVQKVWESAKRVRDSEYGKVSEELAESFEMSVIVQEMVDASWSGVCFSINPVTGRDELIIEGIEGSGESLVQQGKKPFRWVYGQGAWVDSPGESSPGMEALDALVAGVIKLRKLWHKEVDVEWVFDGGKLYYLQCRGVTTRKYPVIFSNRLSREFLPGMIKPLVWSVNIPVVNSAWIRLLKAMLGPLNLKPEQLSHSFYYRAYFNMGTMGELFRKLGFPRNSLERLLGREDPSGKSPFRPGLKTFRYVPRMLWFLLSNLRLGKKFNRWMTKEDRNNSHLEHELGEGFTIELYPLLFDQLMHRAKDAAYYNIIIPLSMHLANRMLKRKLDRRGISMEALDFFLDFPELKDFDPQYELLRLNKLWTRIPGEVRDMILKHSDLHLQRKHPEVELFCLEFESFMDSFGHFSESGNDLSYPHWKEAPDFVMNLIKKSGSQKEGGSQRKEEIETKDISRSGGRVYDRVGRFRVYREMISSVYTREYGIFRILFLQTGASLTEWGLIHNQEDVFYLTLEEHDELIQKREDFQDRSAKERIASRKQEMKEYAAISLPTIIYGEVPPPVATKDEQVFQGIPTSPGQFRGKIVVVKGYEDFDKEVENSILVIPFADVGWTPLLVKAAAIVAESGGMLSHAAIVARELSIPSISSVDHACQLEDGSLAMIDGSNGSLILLK